MDKDVVVHIHNRILHKYKNEHIWVSSNEVDETGAYYTEWSPKQKHKYSILTRVYGIQKDGNDDPISKIAQETQM